MSSQRVATSSAIVAHKEQVHKRVLCALAQPNHRTRDRRTTAHRTGTVGHGLQVKRPPSLERGLRQLQAVAIAVGANFSLGDLQGRHCSARPAGWCEPWRNVLTMLARPIAKARAEKLSLAASNVEEVLACSALALAAALALCACCLRARPLGDAPGWSRPAPATSSKPLPSVHRGARR